MLRSCMGLVARSTACAAGVAFGAAVAAAALVEVARDDAANYSFDQGWTGNGGFGFEDWVFQTTNTSETGGATGFFLTGPPNTDIDRIASSSNRTWGTYANGTNGWQACAAFRAFKRNSALVTDGLAVRGESFRVAFEHGNIDGGGAVGFCLRRGNAHARPDDYNVGARFEFAFLGGSSNYTIFAAAGVIDTGVPYREDGLDVELALTDPNGFVCTIRTPGGSGPPLRVIAGMLGGSGPIQSVALFNRKSSAFAFNNTYFNRMSVRRDLPQTLIVR